GRPAPDARWALAAALTFGRCAELRTRRAAKKPPGPSPGPLPAALRQQLKQKRAREAPSEELLAGWLAVESCSQESALQNLTDLDASHLQRVSAGCAESARGKGQLTWALKKEDPKAYFSYVAEHPEAFAQQLRDRDKWREGLPQVLMVAEKPSVARLVADFLSSAQRQKLRERRGLSPACPVLEFPGTFPATNQRCVITVTSVIGHLCQLEFDGQLPQQLEGIYQAPVVKTYTDSARKARVAEHLQELAKGSEHLCLWLDADREGENIGFEVIAVCKEWFPDNSRVHRAIFSALTQEEVCSSFESLGKPDADVAKGVDARQELDLRVGISFSRLLTRKLRDETKAQSVTYGPCQTPALGFCVARHGEIEGFQPRKVWTPRVEASGLAWAGESTERQEEATKIRAALSRSSEAPLQLEQREERVPRPVGLNTVQLLRSASNALNLGPKQAMKLAEDLYSKGLISYPRTETTRYHETFDASVPLRAQQRSTRWGRSAAKALGAWKALSQVQSRRARDVGDHPPIVPLRLPQRGELRGQENKLYDFVSQHFVASWLGDARLRRHEARLQIDGFEFQLQINLVEDSGWLEAMPWRLKELSLDEDSQRQATKRLAALRRMGSSVPLRQGRLLESHTEAPRPLTEAELVEKMDKNGIGTDASIPQHIQTIQDRGYVQLCDGNMEPILPPRFGPGRPKQQKRHAPGRYLVPTARGLALVEGLSALDASLCQPEVRALIEQQCAQVAMRQLDQEEVLRRNIALFRSKFQPRARMAL
ncbi:unnamed protein product, partial [Effrenium voratum]